MIKKVLCLMTALVLVSACDTTSGAGDGSVNGKKLSEALGHGTKYENPNVADRVFFDYDKSILGAEDRATLDSQVAWLKKWPNLKLVIEGHADERGTREYNLALGERRATAVKNYLVADGFKAKHIKTVSYGKERPAVTGSDETAWAQNRRAVTVVVDKK
jgi:peptidoglycan-associated lipoprotein